MRLNGDETRQSDPHDRGKRATQGSAVTLCAMQGRATNLGNVVSLLGAFVATAMVDGPAGGRSADPRSRRHRQRGDRAASRCSTTCRASSPPPSCRSSPRIKDARGGILATPQQENRIIVNLKQVAPIMQKAQIAIEDSRFYEHGGVDPRGIMRAVASNAQGGDVQGASTLTQQYVKLTLQENALRNNDEEAAQAAVAQERGPQDPGDQVRGHPREGDDQGPDPRRATSTSPTTATSPTASRRPRSTTSASARRSSTSRRRPCWPASCRTRARTDPVHYPEKAQARRDVVLDRMHGPRHHHRQGAQGGQGHPGRRRCSS